MCIGGHRVHNPAGIGNADDGCPRTQSREQSVVESLAAPDACQIPPETESRAEHEIDFRRVGRRCRSQRLDDSEHSGNAIGAGFHGVKNQTGAIDPWHQPLVAVSFLDQRPKVGFIGHSRERSDPGRGQSGQNSSDFQADFFTCGGIGLDL